MKKTPKEIADRAKSPAECDSLLKNAIENGWDEITVEVRKRSIYLRAKLEDPAEGGSGGATRAGADPPCSFMNLATTLAVFLS